MNDIFTAALTDALRELNLSLGADALARCARYAADDIYKNIAQVVDALARCARYAALLAEANAHVNLTAITDPADMAVKHFADSLAVLAFVDLPEGASVADVGTGAGFPGIPLLIARPDLRITLLDGTGKKLDFVKNACAELDLSPKIVHRRAEDAGHLPDYRDRFDFTVARAVAALPALAEYCLPLVTPGGAFIAFKSNAAEELSAAHNAFVQLGGKYEACHAFTLSGCTNRSIVLVRKISQTPPKYPRPSTQIAKKPL